MGGGCHGITGFNTFSHNKSVYKPSSLFDAGRLRNAPYTTKQADRLVSLINALPGPVEGGMVKNALILGLSVAVIVLSVAVAYPSRFH